MSRKSSVPPRDTWIDPRDTLSDPFPPDEAGTHRAGAAKRDAAAVPVTIRFESLESFESEDVASLQAEGLELELVDWDAKTEPDVERPSDDNERTDLDLRMDAIHAAALREQRNGNPRKQTPWNNDDVRSGCESARRPAEQSQRLERR